jgi:hypothetical protein
MDGISGMMLEFSFEESSAKAGVASSSKKFARVRRF